MKQARILIVEDERLSAEDIRLTLERKYTVTSIESTGEDAVRKAGLDKPDLILMDIMLKGRMDGIQAAEAIRSRFNIPIVFLTAYADDHILERAKISSSYGYVTKPFTGRELHTNIEMALHKSRLDRQIIRLNSVLQVTKNVNRLISRERERGRLLQGICDIFTQHRGYESAWIVLLGPKGHIESSAQSGLRESSFQQLLQMVEDGLCPQCIKRVQLQPVDPGGLPGKGQAESEALITENRQFTCRDCPLLNDNLSQSALTSRLKFEDRLFGFITVLIPMNYPIDDAELSLFNDVISDIGFALHTLDVEALVKRYYQNLEFLSSTVLESLVLSPKTNIYRYIGEHLHRQLERAVIIISMCRKSLDSQPINQSINVSTGSTAKKFNNTPDTISDRTPDNTPDTISDTISDRTPDNTPDTISDTISDRTPDNTPDTISDTISDNTPDNISDNISDKTSDKISNKTSNKVLMVLEVKEMIGFPEPPPRITIPLTPTLKREITSNKLNPLSTKTSAAFAAEMAPQFQSIANLMEKGQAYSIGFTREKQVFGNVLIILEKGDELKNKEIIETFINQTAIILHRRLIEAELMESENKFRSLAEITPGAIFIHRGQNIIYANKATETITGYTQKELKKMDFQAIAAPIHREKQKRVGLELLAGKKSFSRAEMGFKKKNGDICWVEVISKGFEYEGSPAVMVTAVDISDLKKAQENERRYTEQLMQADKMISLGTLVSGVAHEINNPNNAIIVNTPVLKDLWEGVKPIVDDFYQSNGDFDVGGIPYSEVPQSMADLFTGVVESSKRIKGIVNDLKDFARPGLFDLFHQVDINHVVKQSITLLTNMLVNATRDFTVTYAPSPPPVKGNSQQLQQVVINLIQNACQAIQDKQKAIRVFTLYEPHLNQVIIGVEDEGRGIPLKNLKFITDPFFTTKRDIGGTGLGLSVSSRIIKDHKGSLDVVSKVGSGTLFKIVLPADISINHNTGTNNNSTGSSGGQNNRHPQKVEL